MNICDEDMSPILNESSAIQLFKCGNAIEIRARIIYIWDCHMWQSRVEIERYSIVYFDHITAFIATALAQNFR